jgi:hypothetical protein
MSVEVNQAVVTGFKPFNLDGYYFPNLPTFAKPACLSNVEQAPWTNRVPQHEPWPRTLMSNTSPNAPSDEFLFNTNHNPQFVDDGGGTGSESINRVDGSTTVPRGTFWRR